MGKRSVLSLALNDKRQLDTIRYDTIQEFNVDSKAECGQLNLAHKARNKKIKKETKTKQTPVPT